jgi:hypothetical protein
VPRGVTTISNCLLSLCDECGSCDKYRSQLKHKLMGYYKENRLSSLWGSVVIIMHNLDKRSEFVPGHVHMVYVVVKVAIGQVFLQAIRFSPVNIVSQMSHSQLQLRSYS